MNLLTSQRIFHHLLLVGLLACGGACTGGGSSPPADDQRPEITAEKIREDINGERVKVPPAEGITESRSWGFYRNEPKEIEIVEKQLDGDSATIVIDMRTGSAPQAEKPKKLSGRLRLHYRLEKGLVLRQWEIVEIDNLSFAYQQP